MKTTQKALLTIAIVVVSLMLIALAVFAVFTLLPTTTNTAFAVDNFEVIFPKNDYFQSQNPTLIAANATYLVIYDESNSTLFVRGGSQVGTYNYAIPFDSVTDVFAVGNNAFLATEDGNYYTIDLTNTSATPIQKTLSTPERISYLNSDGQYLYAKSSMGQISIYDQDLQIAFGVDNVQNDLFTGHHVIVGNDTTLCAFITKIGYPYFVSYDFATSQTTEILIDTQVQDASLANVIFANVEGKIVCIDKTNGKTLFSTQIEPNSFCAYANSLYTIEGEKIYIYNLNQDLSGLTLFSTISMSGADDKHLDTPLDVAYFDNNVVVADSKNSRIAYVDNASTSVQSVELDAKPIALATAQHIYSALDNGTIVKIANKQIEQTYTLDGVKDVAYLDKLYALTNNGVYTNIGLSMVKITSIENSNKIACNPDGTNVYVLSDTGITCLNQNGKILYTVSHDLTNAVDFDVDYAGNFVVAYQNEIVVFENCFTTLQEKSRASLASSSTMATLTSATLDGSTLYFGASECFVGKMNVNVITKDTFVGIGEPTITANENFRFAKIKDNTTTVCINKTARADSASLQNDDTIIIFDNLQNNGFNWAIAGGKLSLVNANDYDTVIENATNGEYVTSNSTTLYTIPYVVDGSVSVDANVTLIGIDNACSFDGNGWLKIEYNDAEYYVKSSEIGKLVNDVEVYPPESKTQYGRAKAERVGGTVGIWATNDTSLSPIVEIVDGTKFEVLSVEGELVIVKYENTVGYMLASQVQLEGLTTVQIVAIVLSVIVLVTGTVIFASIYLTKKKNENKVQ